MQPIFPGMDPFLEGSGLWPDFHNAFLTYARESLRRVLPSGYFAVLESRHELGIAETRRPRIAVPDVTVKHREPGSGVRPGSSSPRGALATTEPEHLVIVEQEAVDVVYLEIRSVDHRERIVTVIELLSPSNKFPGSDRESFERRAQAILQSDVHWVEIDLLRGGRKLACHPGVEAHCQARGYEYTVAVSRASRRAPELDLELYGFGVRDRFPVIAVPLSEPDPDAPLDLGEAFRRTWEEGPYSGLIAYDGLPKPPLKEADELWARERIEQWREGQTPGAPA